jgi:hypothetical protein
METNNIYAEKSLKKAFVFNAFFLLLYLIDFVSIFGVLNFKFPSEKIAEFVLVSQMIIPLFFVVIIGYYSNKIKIKNTLYVALICILILLNLSLSMMGYFMWEIAQAFGKLDL